MSKFKEYMGNYIDDNPIWSRLEKNFDKYYINDSKVGDNIPKKIHQIWLGGDIPKKYDRLRKTWQEKNPDWEYKLWTDKDVESFGMENIESFNIIDNLGAKSDIFRYEILYREGGIYVDTDFECFLSFNELTYLDYFSGTGHVDKPETFNSIIACKKGYSFMKVLIDNIDVVNTKNFNDILSLTGPTFLSNNIFDWIKNNPSDKIVIFPTTYFFPFPAIHRHSVIVDNLKSQNIVNSFKTDLSFCAHLWYTSWQK